ncbi:uncharacterized protein LOC119830723 [Zerene cesonia]|uniref:uncharacterized protein LOC119830723 n=1 Tax=Zerene cesonia TaxID=33412 RepID=UPI0018E58C6B|nr:uncharacterized protein LOC119830723 [Zerene cesonia]
MKAQVIFLFSLWITVVTVYASTTTENVDIFNLIQTENNEPQTTEEINLDNSDPEQKGDELNTSSESYLESNVDATVDIVIEENIKTPLDALIPEMPDVDLDETAIGDEEILYNDVVNRDPSEIMDTAAGFVPIPIIKRRQKPQKRYGLRRHFLRNPHRRYQHFYPYYYYRYYRPSSLRYFYY